MRNLREAETKARELFGSSVERVAYYTQPTWRCTGWRGFRVTMVGDIIHWMTPRGRHEKEVCCRPLAMRNQEKKVEVVRR